MRLIIFQFLFAANKLENRISPSKRRLETPEERRKRNERVLKENSRFANKSSKLTRSALSMSAFDLSSVEPMLQAPFRSSANRYRPQMNRERMKRNNSLSPLRFANAIKYKADEIKESDENQGYCIRRFKSEQNLEDIILDSSDEESLNNSIDPNEPFHSEKMFAKDDKDDDDHLLAPSKVAKSQELFKQIFFPVDLHEKPLLTKEEIAKERNRNISRPTSDISLSTESDIQDSTSLRVDYLSHLRRDSISPEQRQRERELTTLNNTVKFRCYQDFWENKTNEILGKNRKFNQWKSSNGQPIRQVSLINVLITHYQIRRDICLFHFAPISTEH